MRIVEVVADVGHTDTLTSIAQHYGAIDVWRGAELEDGRHSLRMLVSPDKRQAILDALQSVLGSSENVRILVMPVDAVLPRATEADQEAATSKAKSASATREELYDQIEKGAHLDINFLLLVVLSTIVAAIGLREDNVAVVVGAMVIAPLLGPNIALAFATSLGDRALFWRSLKTDAAGLALALGLALIIGFVWPVNLESEELMARTDVGMDSVGLALASGTAAVLSLATGLSSALVGVMVAVALLPRAATLGLMLGSGQQPYFKRNVVRSRHENLLECRDCNVAWVGHWPGWLCQRSHSR
jgi:uncharacterized hydrophobic protein (TIGR00341 family)